MVSIDCSVAYHFSEVSVFDRLFKKDASDETPMTGPQSSGAQQETPLQAQLQAEIIKRLKEIYDPEIPLNIYDLGLIYAIDVDPQGYVAIDMTLTTPACPVAASFPEIVANSIRTIDGVTDVNVKLVWDPPWTQDKLSEAAKLQLGMF